MPPDELPNEKPLHPFCKECGWRRGGADSWDGKTCKCKLWEPPIKRFEATILPLKCERDQ